MAPKSTSHKQAEEKVIFFGEEPKEKAIPAGEEKSKSMELVPLVSYPLVALREGVVFPNTESILTFARHRSVAAIEEAIKSRRQVVLVTQRTDSVADPADGDLYSVGVVANIERILKGEQEVNALVHAVSRVKILNINRNKSYLECEIETLPDIDSPTPEVSALCKVLTSEFRKAVNLGKSVEFLNFMKLMGGVNPSELADQISSTLELPTKKKQKLLEMRVVEERLEKVLEYVGEEIKILEIERNITSKTQKKFDKHARENILRERMRVIQRELGESGEEEEEQELDSLKRAIERSAMPLPIKKKALKEWRRLTSVSEMSSESGYLRTWLETVVELPWAKLSKKNLSLEKAKRILDEDHYGLDEVKDRILEFLAVMKLRQSSEELEGNEKPSKLKNLPKTKIRSDRMPTILCFVGAPGVGKTSLGKSIARALGREFVKVSLGGIRDEAEIRGHRRTYVGAMPGRIISAMKQAGRLNPVFMLDEIDKIGLDYRGDPSAALLEALDPEQNSGFEDHYLDVPFDLSHTMFITTANTTDTIPAALLDRLEIIPYSGYTADEKFEIAKQYLLPKQLKTNAVTTKQVKVPDSTLRDLISFYTREAGVRSLERAVGKLTRKAARLIAEGKEKTVLVNEKRLIEFLGPHMYEHSVIEKKDEVGLVNGLAWTSVGGDTLQVEVALIPNQKVTALTLTGQLGKVMQESGRAALTYVRANAKLLKISETKLKQTEVHIHVPEGAVPKDGPSAGITMTTALVSALTARPVRRDIAMTGEVTLRGRVLEIGGLKEKVIAAHRAGIKTVIAPKMNEKDFGKFPEKIKKDIQFHWVESMDEVIGLALV
jgi:ATP-dependent Lon protease